MPSSSLLIYILRHDLRLQDNPIFDAVKKLKQEKHSKFTHFLPLYIFPADQVEVSGFISNGKSPYPEARSAVASFWRCGPLRAKFLAESVWDLKEELKSIGSDLEIRVGMLGEVVSNLTKARHNDKDANMNVGAVWMTSEEGVEEKRQEREIKAVCEKKGAEFKLFTDEKYLIDDRDILESVPSPKDLPDNFTSYRKMMEPLREAPRPVLPTVSKSSLLPLPKKDDITPQHDPFAIPSNYSDLEVALLSPVRDLQIPNPPVFPTGTQSAHPFKGGARSARNRLDHLIASGLVSVYANTRNGLLGEDYSTKMSAFLALGCITARQIHESLLRFENGTSELGSGQKGYGAGSNKGTESVRFELLWRDYMRLCTRKFGQKLFRLSGFREDHSYDWKSPSNPRELSKTEVQNILHRWINGTTGMGLIDAAQRELILTGYTSNRARQNVASFLTKHLGLDWRLGAEWYECCLVDYDLSSNWGNWQYVSGVGCDPRQDRKFNPVKQAHDYDPRAEYIKAWIPELRAVEENSYAYQAWEVPREERAGLRLSAIDWVERPLKRINFVVNRRPTHPRPRKNGKGSGNNSGRSSGRGGVGGGSPTEAGPAESNENGTGGVNPSSGPVRGNRSGFNKNRGSNAYGGSSRGHYGASRGPYMSRGLFHGGGRENRMGMMDRDAQTQQAGGL